MSASSGNGNFHCQVREHENKPEEHSNLHIYQKLANLQFQFPNHPYTKDDPHLTEYQWHFLSITLQGHLPAHIAIDGSYYLFP